MRKYHINRSKLSKPKPNRAEILSEADKNFLTMLPYLRENIGWVKEGYRIVRIGNYEKELLWVA